MTDHEKPAQLFSGVILAGGLSRRMGSDKAERLLGDKTLLQRVIARLSPQVSALALNADSLPDGIAPMPLVPDIFPGKAGPLAGIVSAMRHAATHHPEASHVVTTTVDSPFIPDDLVARLAASLTSSETIALATSAGEDHPVTALWPVSIADDLENWLQNDENRRVRRFQLRHSVTRVYFPLVATSRGPFDPFFNINTPHDLAEAEQWLTHLPP